MHPEGYLKVSKEMLLSLSPRAKQRLLRFLIRWGRYDSALPIARVLAEEAPDGILYPALLAQTLIALGEVDEASEVVADLEDRHRGRPMTLEASACLQMALGNLPESLKLYLQMLELNTDSTNAWRGMAQVYYSAGQIDKAHRCCQQVIQICASRASAKPGSPPCPYPNVMRILADIHRRSSDNKLAEEIEMQLLRDERKEELQLLDEITPRASYNPRQPQNQPPIVDEPPVAKLHADAKTALTEVFGHASFGQGQEEAISSIMAGQDLLVVMPTGGGKSLCYQLPAVLGLRVVVITPLKALMKDQLDGLPASLSNRSVVINSDLESDDMEKEIAKIAEGCYDLIYAAPERLRQAPFLYALKRAGINLFVVDEVHCLSIWGHDFRPDYLFIAPALELLGRPTFCGMTATAPSAIREEIASHTGRNLITVSAGTYRANLFLQVKRVSTKLEKLRAISKFCLSEPGSGIIYADTRKGTEEIASFLRTAGVEAEHYHAGMTPEERVAVQDIFMSGNSRIIVATVAFGMGVDKPDVRFVIHFSPPKSVENYYQEAGRAGRDGLVSTCLLFCSPSDAGTLTKRANAPQLTIEQLKYVYDCIKKLIPHGSGLIHIDDIQRDTRLYEVSVRVAVSLLEKAGLLTRRLDVPINVSLKVRHSADLAPELTLFVKAAHLRVGQRVALDATELAARSGIPLSRLEWTLLEWRDRGWIFFRTSGRTMHLERNKPPSNAKQLLEDLLQAQAVSAKTKASKLLEYVRTNDCRHDYILQHFGEEPIQKCSTCDNCCKRHTPSTFSDTHLLILRGICSLPIRLGRSGLAKAFTGCRSCPIQPHEWPHLGALSSYSRNGVEGLLDDLRDWGYLERDGSPLRPLLVLTPAGRKLAVSEADRQIPILPIRQRELAE